MRKPLILLAAMLVAAVTVQAGDIYRWKDANGSWHYADQPVPGAERIDASTRGVENRSNAAPPPANPAASRPTTAAASPASGDIAQKVRADVATAKASKCKEAQDNYEQSISARRLARVTATGERELLTDEEMEAAQVAARSTMEYYCGK
jgi:Domain of unknown function (DUF4124)